MLQETVDPTSLIKRKVCTHISGHFYSAFSNFSTALAHEKLSISRKALTSEPLKQNRRCRNCHVYSKSDLFGLERRGGYEAEW